MIRAFHSEIDIPLEVFVGLPSDKSAKKTKSGLTLGGGVAPAWREPCHNGHRAV